MYILKKMYNISFVQNIVELTQLLAHNIGRGRWMDGWMEWTDGLMDGRMNGQMDGWTDR